MPAPATTRRRRTRRSNWNAVPVEAFEVRLLPAGNVTAVFDGLDLEIQGDAKGNQIQVVFNGVDVVVRGLNGTTVNGGNADFVAAPATDTLPGGLFIDTFAGRDVVHVRDVKTTLVLAVDGGDGNDRIIVQNVDTLDLLSLDPGAGHDQVRVESVTTAGELTISDMEGKSLILLEDVTSARDVGIFTGNSRDLVSFDTVVGTSLFVSTLGGNDIVSTTGSCSGDNLSLDLGEGRDLVFIGGMTTTDPAGRSMVQMGRGNDALGVLNADFQAPMHLFGGSGRNVLLLTPGITTPNGSVTQEFETLLDFQGFFQKVLDANEAVEAEVLEFLDFIASLP